MTGRFFWHELAVRDVPAAIRFYGTVVGWRAEPVEGNGDYVRLTAHDCARAGLRQVRDDEPAHWLPYIAVDDVEVTSQAVETLGGSVIMPMIEIPGLVRFALVADPDGVPFYVGKGLIAVPEPQDQTGCGPLGTVCWNELAGRSGEKSLQFFSGLFGWEKHQGFDMGPLGTYQLYGLGDADYGGMMSAPDNMQPGWMLYFAVDDVDAAAGRVRQAGGTVLRGPDEVPGGAWTLQCRDPEGVGFGLVGGRAAK